MTHHAWRRLFWLGFVFLIAAPVILAVRGETACRARGGYIAPVGCIIVEPDGTIRKR